MFERYKNDIVGLKMSAISPIWYDQIVGKRVRSVSFQPSDLKNVDWNAFRSKAGTAGRTSSVTCKLPEPVNFGADTHLCSPNICVYIYIYIYICIYIYVCVCVCL